jgi:excisionase family DNA binding protein
VQAKVQIVDGLLNLKEAAAFLQVKERTLRELCHDNRITHIRLKTGGDGFFEPWGVGTDTGSIIGFSIDEAEKAFSPLKAYEI